MHLVSTSWNSKLTHSVSLPRSAFAVFYVWINGGSHKNKSPHFYFKKCPFNTCVQWSFVFLLKTQYSSDFLGFLIEAVMFKQHGLSSIRKFHSYCINRFWSDESQCVQHCAVHHSVRFFCCSIFIDHGLNLLHLKLQLCNTSSQSLIVGGFTMKRVCSQKWSRVFSK